MKTLCCLLEEPSAKEALKVILYKLFGDSIIVRIIPFQGKTDLEKNMERKINGWNIPDTVFLVMRDQDSGDCIEIKNKLFEIVKKTRKESNTLIRIACHELESFFLGDLQAVEKGLNINLNAQNSQNNRKFRDPDNNLANPSDELIKLTQGKYMKVKGSRKIAPHLKTDGSNKSCSFNCLISGLKRIIEL